MNFTHLRGNRYDTPDPDEFDAGDVRRRWNLPTPQPHHVLTGGDARRVIQQQESEEYSGYSYGDSISYRSDGNTDYKHPNFGGRRQTNFEKGENVGGVHLISNRSTISGKKGFFSDVSAWMSDLFFAVFRTIGALFMFIVNLVSLVCQKIIGCFTGNWLILTLLILSLGFYAFHNKQNNGRDFMTAVQQDSSVASQWANEMRDSLPESSEVLENVIDHSKQIGSKFVDLVTSLAEQLNQIGLKIADSFHNAFSSTRQEFSEKSAYFSDPSKSAEDASKKIKEISSSAGNLFAGVFASVSRFSTDSTCKLCQILKKVKS